MNDQHELTASERIALAREAAERPQTATLRMVPTDMLAGMAERAETNAAANEPLWPKVADHQRRAAAAYRAELQRRDDDARRLEENDEQRDYAEERANAELLRDGDRGIGAVLTLPALTVAELERYADQNPQMAPAVVRELAKRCRLLAPLD